MTIKPHRKQAFMICVEAGAFTFKGIEFASDDQLKQLADLYNEYNESTDEFDAIISQCRNQFAPIDPTSLTASSPHDQTLSLELNLGHVGLGDNSLTFQVDYEYHFESEGELVLSPTIKEVFLVSGETGELLDFILPWNAFVKDSLKDALAELLETEGQNFYDEALTDHIGYNEEPS